MSGMIDIALFILACAYLLISRVSLSCLNHEEASLNPSGANSVYRAMYSAPSPLIAQRSARWR